MGRTKSSTTSNNLPKVRPALNPQSRENQMISYAVDLAEKQLRDGTASSQVIVHFLKLGTAKELLERERLEEENKLLRAKTKALEEQKEIRELYTDALKAMRKYGGHGESDDDY